MRLRALALLLALGASLLLAGCGGGDSGEDDKKLPGKPKIIETPEGTVPPGDSRAAPSQSDEARG